MEKGDKEKAAVRICVLQWKRSSEKINRKCSGQIRKRGGSHSARLKTLEKLHGSVNTPSERMKAILILLWMKF